MLSLVFSVCCVGSGLCYKPIDGPEESHRVCVSVCGLETSTMKRPRPDLNCKAITVQSWTGPEGSRRLRLPDFKTIGT